MDEGLLIQPRQARNGDNNGNGNGSNPFAGMSPWMRFIAFIGVPAAIALFLVYRLDGRSAQELAGISAELRAHQAVSTVMATEIADHKQETKTLIVLMRQICVNTSKNDQQRRECVQ
jgi:hypothetical protein